MATKKAPTQPKVDTQVDFSGMIKALEELMHNMNATALSLNAKANAARDQSDALEAAAYDISSAIDALNGIEVD